MKLQMLLAAVLFHAVVALSCWAQSAGDDGWSATVMKVTTRGKTVTLAVTDEQGQERDVSVTPKTELEIRSKGSDEFLTAGTVVKAIAVESNDLLFSGGFSVFPEHAAKIGPAKVTKAPSRPGQSQNAYLVVGEIASLEDPEEGGKYKLLKLKEGGKNAVTVYVEPSHSVTVVQSETSHLTEGQKIKISGKQAGKLFQATSVIIETGKTVKPADVAPADKKGK